MVNDYEMIPEKDFDSLKNDVEKIKKSPLTQSSEGRELKESIDKLNDSISNLTMLFRSASDSIKAESHDNDIMSKKIVPLFDKVEKLSEQNEKIARGIVALAEMFDEFKTKQQNEGVRVKADSIDQSQSMNFSNPNVRESNMPQQLQQSGASLPPLDDFSSPFGPPSQGSQPLPRMQMPQAPPQAPAQKRKMFGFG